MPAYVQVTLPDPPPVLDAVWVEKSVVLDLADRLFKQGQRNAAMALEQRAGLVKEGQRVAIQPALARRYGL